MTQAKHSSTITEMVNVTFQKSIGTGGECVGTVPAGSTLLQAAIAAGVHLQSACGGKGTCGKCRVILSPEDRTGPLPEEKKFLRDELSANGVVLACKRVVESDMDVFLIEQKDVFDRKTQLGQENKVYELAPLVRKHFVCISVPSTSDQRSDWERLVAELPKSETPLRFNRRIAAKLPRILREASFQVTVVTAGDELLAVEPGDTSAGSYGLAIDIGTTTVVVYLINIVEGRIVARGALTNPQQGAGADVLSRIAYAADHPAGLNQLQTQVVGGLNQIISDLCQEERIKPEEIYQAVVVGNTTMSHLFLGIDPTYLAPAPFIPGFRQSVTVKASELGLRILSDGAVTVLPIVAGYVGSDTVGVMLSGQADQLEGNHLLVDIGTNGEIVLVGKGRILSCSTAAGPAFEGAGIKHGMRAADGAIERVKITEDIELGIIGKENEKVRGICGSGLIDAVSEMHRAGIIDSGGRMISSEDDLEKLPTSLRERVLYENGSREFVLAWKEESAAGENITITQKDIRGLQLAKGAVLAGVRILLSHLGLKTEDLDMIHLAGAFGNYISKESALGIGLLPQVSLDKIQSIGNAAGNGAQMALLSTDAMERSNRLARDAEHIELSTEKIFQDEFLESLALGQSY
ncbi:MAG TPA: metal-binding protein [Desulfosporosinus sp.]|nr:metal-binding protein [Desulfosporosinus sp.]